MFSGRFIFSFRIFAEIKKVNGHLFLCNYSRVSEEKRNCFFANLRDLCFFKCFGRISSCKKKTRMFPL